MALPDSKYDRKARPVVRGLLDYFPDACAAVANLSYIGNEQHNPGQEMHWARGKSDDHADCLVRHLMERGTMDNDGVPHATKVAWRALALLQLELERWEQYRCDFDISDHIQLDINHGEDYASKSLNDLQQGEMDQEVRQCAYCGTPETSPDHDPNCPYCAGWVTFHGMPVAYLDRLDDLLQGEEPVCQTIKEADDNQAIGPLTPSQDDLISLLRMADWYMRWRDRQPLDSGDRVWYNDPALGTSEDLDDVKQPPNPEKPASRSLNVSEVRELNNRLLQGGYSERIVSALLAGLSVPWEDTLFDDRPVVYIAGPMRGHDYFNFPAFDDARDRLTEKGFRVISPADIDCGMGGPEEDAHDASVGRDLAMRDFCALHSLSGENDDGIVMLPGWEKSTGALAEFHTARWMRLRILNQHGAPLTHADTVDIAGKVIEIVQNNS